MRLTVLGKSPAWQDAGGACSGYLVESGGTRLLLDCGPGILGQLRQVCDYAAVDAVVISHLHADHILDLVSFASALTYGPRWAEQPAPTPALHLPPGGRDQMAALGSASGMGADHVESAFALEEYDPDARLEIGPLQLRFQLVPHYVEAYAIDVAQDGVRLTFGADSGPSEALARFAEGTDLLLIEATLDAPDDGEPRGHLTPREAGEHGRRAHARRLVITHRSDELDAEAARAAAAEAYGGDVTLAATGAVYDVTP